LYWMAKIGSSLKPNYHTNLVLAGNNADFTIIL